MTVQERKAAILDNLSQLTEDVPFTVEFVAKKRPRGVIISIEVTKERLNEIIAAAQNR